MQLHEKAYTRVGKSLKQQNMSALFKPKKIMKRIILMSVFALVAVFSSNSASAFKLFGIEFSWKRGKPEWNATKTGTECIGRGMCTGTIKGNVDIPSLKIVDGTEKFDIENQEYSSIFVNYNDKLAIEFSKKYYNTFKEDFENDEFDINGDFKIEDEIIKNLNLTHSGNIKSGAYHFIIDEKSGAYLVILE